MNLDDELILAVETGDRKLVKQLINQGANVNYTTLFTLKIPLVEAIYNSDIPMIKLLLENGADINRRYGYPVRWPLLIAVLQQNIPVIKYLLQNGAQLDIIDPILGRDVFSVAIQRNRNDILQLLLETNPDPTLLENSLDIAVELENLEAIRLIREYQRIHDTGIPIRSQDRYGRDIEMTGRTGRKGGSHILYPEYEPKSYKRSPRRKTSPRRK